MAHVKGRAGLGTVDQIVNYRLTGNTAADIQPKGSPFIGFVAGIAAGIVTFIVAIVVAIMFTDGDATGTPHALALIATLIAGVGVGTYAGTAPKLNPRNIRYYRTRDSAMRQFLAAKANSSNDLSATFAEREIPLVIGGFGEMRTEEKLARLPDTYTVFHDIACIKPDGRTSANIDHLVIGPSSAIAIDTKIWGTPLQPASHGASHTYLPYGSPYWKAIGTCLYELTFLPKEPTCLIIAVGGKAGKALASTGVLRITDYIPQFDSDETTRPVPCPVPVIIVTQNDLTRVVQAHDNAARAHGATMPPFSVREIENSKKLSS